MHERSSTRFRAQYNGHLYEQESSLDPRLLIPGAMIALVSVPLLVLTWPIATPLIVTGIGVTLVCLGFAKHNRFTASSAGYCFSWSVGPLGSKTQIGPQDAKPILVASRLGTYQIKIRRGQQNFDPLIEAANRREAEAWRAFFVNVTQGKPAVVPRESKAWVFSGRK